MGDVNGGGVNIHWNKVLRIGNLCMMDAAGVIEDEVYVTRNLGM